ncbi:MAG: NAD(P)/FAD-dependent oxidoreductase [Methylococcales bacterium]
MNSRAAHQSDYDVIIAGGGPAGSTAATLLAQYGHRVLLLEKDTHPRFHIGESMLPFSEPVMERLGIDWSQYGIAKAGAEFIDETVNKRMYFQLSVVRQAYQIERAGFDEALFINAQKHGADTYQNSAVTAVNIDQNGVKVTTDNANYLSRYLIDATGRSAMMGRRKRSINRIENLGKFALYTHFSQVTSQVSTSFFQQGNIVIPIIDIGWIWIIPLAGQRISVGLVVSGQRPADETTTALFQRYLQQSDFLQQLLDGATQDWPIRSEANFSYVNQQRYGERYVCCGDAAGFLDPVFSSGVFLALTGGARVADRVHQGLIEKREDDADLHAVDDADYNLSFATMRVFIERFYQTSLVHNVFFEADRDERIKREISQLLAGNMWSGNNAWQQGLLHGRYSGRSH